MLSKREREFLKKSEAKVRAQGYEAAVAFFLNDKDFISEVPNEGETAEAAHERAYFARLIFEGFERAREAANARAFVQLIDAVREALQAFLKGGRLLQDGLTDDFLLKTDAKTLYLAAAQTGILMEFEAVFGEDAPKIRRRLMYNVPFWADEEAEAEENYLKDVMCEMFIDKKGIFAEKTN